MIYEIIILKKYGRGFVSWIERGCIVNEMEQMNRLCLRLIFW